MPAYAALLRAVNLGDTNKVSMPTVRSLFSALGYEDVSTYVQTGNVVFRTGSRDARKISAEIQRVIEKQLGVTTAVILRTAADLRKVVDANPYAKDEQDPTKLQVLFLDRRPPAGAKRALDPDRSPPDRFELRGRELYLHRPAGSARSKLTIAYFERCLGAKGTVRNWRTATRLADMTAALARPGRQ
jgi:uncharacterized protein (DUF1697 family)